MSADWTVWWQRESGGGWYSVRRGLTEEDAKEEVRRLNNRCAKGTYVATPPAVYPWD